MNEQQTQVSPPLDWTWTEFAHLSNSQLYSILHLRQQVFIIEQQCPYDDIDHLDDVAFHLRGCDGATPSLLAYLRVLPPRTRFHEPSIGRLVTAADSRHCGLGHELMRRGLAFCCDRFPGLSVRISAQAHLQPFYAAHGFATVTAEHDIDGIPHVEMLRA